MARDYLDPEALETTRGVITDALYVAARLAAQQGCAVQVLVMEEPAGNHLLRARPVGQDVTSEGGARPDEQLAAGEQVLCTVVPGLLHGWNGGPPPAPPGRFSVNALCVVPVCLSHPERRREPRES